MLPLILCIVFLSLGAISLVLFIVEKLKGYSLKDTILKAITSCFFITVAIVSLISKGYHLLTIFVPIGLFFGLLGDIFLELKYVYKEKDNVLTYAGFIAFGVGHIMYILGMTLEFYHGENVLYLIIPVLIGFVVSLLTVATEKVMKLNYGKMKMIAFFYGAILFSMVMTALSMSILVNFKSTTLILIVIGGVLFAISDLILSGTYFGEGKDRPVDLASNCVTYYLAQFIIAFALFFI